MKQAKFIKFPCRFQPEGADAEEELIRKLGITSEDDGKYTVNDIWIDIHRICAFSIHTDEALTWATLDSGLSLALELTIDKFVDAISPFLDVEPMAVDLPGNTSDKPTYLLMDHDEVDENMLESEDPINMNEISDELDILPDEDSEDEEEGLD